MLDTVNEDLRGGPRPLPVILLLDVSGSMYGQKIDTLNNSVRRMIDDLKSEKEMAYRLAAVTFGGSAKVHLRYADIQSVQWQDLGAGGGTPLGDALIIVKDMLEDKDQTPSRSLRPVIVLISDGMPNLGWEGPLNAFVNEGRSSKCDCWAMGIETGPSEEAMLRRFAKPDQEPDRFFQGDAGQIHKFFQNVTMSVSLQAKSGTPAGIFNVGGGGVTVRSSAHPATDDSID